MSKSRSCKPAKHREPRPKLSRRQLSPNLIALAHVIAEHKLETNMRGWFELPWRDGWAAASLALAAFIQFGGAASEFEPIEKWIDDGFVSPTIYELADIELARSSSAILLDRAQAFRFRAAALRCIQLTIANSHGGGHGFNGVLKAAFENVPSHWPETLADEVANARCRDSIGVDLTFDGTSDDRLRRAFVIAWNEGLFHAAYALPRAQGAT